MSITFGDQELFSSGPAYVHVGGLSMRHARELPLSGRGEHVFSQGVHGRSIVQVGTLVGDTPETLETQRTAIEQMLDGVPRQLTDDLQRTWADVVMTAFEPERAAPLGTRWHMRYRIVYVQPSA